MIFCKILVFIYTQTYQKNELLSKINVILLYKYLKMSKNTRNRFFQLNSFKYNNFAKIALFKYKT